MILKTPRESKCQTAKSNLIFELEYRSNFYLIGGLFPAKSQFSFQSHFVSYTECEYFFTCIWKFANWCIFGFKIYLYRKFFNFQIPLSIGLFHFFTLLLIIGWFSALFSGRWANSVIWKDIAVHTHTLASARTFTPYLWAMMWN